MAIAALVAWVLTALGGFVMLAKWISSGGLHQQPTERRTFPPAWSSGTSAWPRPGWCCGSPTCCWTTTGWPGSRSSCFFQSPCSDSPCSPAGVPGADARPSVSPRADPRVMAVCLPSRPCPSRSSPHMASSPRPRSSWCCSRPRGLTPPVGPIPGPRSGQPRVTSGDLVKSFATSDSSGRTAGGGGGASRRLRGTTTPALPPSFVHPRVSGRASTPSNNRRPLTSARPSRARPAPRESFARAERSGCSAPHTHDAPALQLGASARSVRGRVATPMAARLVAAGSCISKEVSHRCHRSFERRVRRPGHAVGAAPDARC